MPTIKAWLQTTAQRLVAVKDSPWLEAEFILAHVLKKDRTWLIAHSDKSLSLKQLRDADRLVRRRLKREPMAYILGEATFFGHKFLVRRGVLIPRPETEELVTRALSTLSSQKKTLVWDVGTGSGAIAIAIALASLRTKIIASDRSRSALTLARQNAARLLRASKNSVAFFQADLLNPKLKRFFTTASFDRLLVVTNLPYLPLSDRRTLAAEVVRYEPSAALFTADSGMFLIKKLLKQLAAFHAADGRALTVLAEFDPPQARALKKYAANIFPHATVIIHKDLNRRNRFLEIMSATPNLQTSDRRL